MIRWKIYYDQGPDFSSEDGVWNDAPTDGVQFVAWWGDDGSHHVLSGSDHYYFHDDGFAATDDLGPLLRKLGFIKFGRWASHRAMEAAAARVRADR